MLESGPVYLLVKRARLQTCGLEGMRVCCGVQAVQPTNVKGRKKSGKRWGVEAEEREGRGTADDMIGEMQATP